MNKYELYLPFSIIIILPVPDRDRDRATACHAKPLTSHTSSARDLFLGGGSAFLETVNQISKNDYWPIMISTLPDQLEHPYS